MQDLVSWCTEPSQVGCSDPNVELGSGDQIHENASCEVGKEILIQLEGGRKRGREGGREGGREEPNIIY